MILCWLLTKRSTKPSGCWRSTANKWRKAPAPLRSRPRFKLRDQLRGKKVAGILSGGNIPTARFVATLLQNRGRVALWFTATTIYGSRFTIHGLSSLLQVPIEPGDSND